MDFKTSPRTKIPANAHLDYSLSGVAETIHPPVAALGGWQFFRANSEISGINAGA
jgi:hypothetical protein